MALTKIGTDAIDALAITEAKLAADSVTAAKIATGAVGTTEIATDAVDTAEIAANAVDSSEIATDAVTATEIAAGAVGSSEIADGAITNADVNNTAAIAISKLATGTQGGTLYFAASGAMTELAVGTSGQFLKTQGASANPVWGTVTTTALTGSTNTWIPTITAANALTGTANFTYDGNVLDVKNSGTASSVKLYCESSNAHYQEIKAAPHAGSTSWTLTLPPTDGAASQYLQTDGAGTTTWATVSSADNTPAFQAYLDATITNFPDEAWTKVAINNEDFDTDSAYDPTTNYRFTVPANEGGKYFLFASVSSENANNDGEKFQVGLYLNGSRIYEDIDFDNTSDSYGWNSITGQVTAIVTLAAADYVEVYAYTRSQNGGGTPFIYAGTKNTKFLGYKMIGL